MNKCPYCESTENHPLVRIDAAIIEYICEDCGCTFNVVEPIKETDPQ